MTAVNAGGRDRSDPELSEVPLEGVLAEFRVAIRDEIEAARRSASSSAVPIINGRRIGEVGSSYQYLFDIENVLNLPGDAPGDLMVPGHSVLEATVISLEGLAITISVATDLGAFVPAARLTSNLTQLMRKLISRIEALRDKPNPAGERIRGASPVSGNPIRLDLPNLNEGQAAAVSSVIGRDTTFIWGPPGTGKTQTIGAIGDELCRRGQSMLLVSHTNSAVDHALLKIGDALALRDPDALANGLVLRVGEPADPRFQDRPELLCSTHVARRSEELATRRDSLDLARRAAVAVVLELVRTITIAEWATDATSDLASTRSNLAALRHTETERDLVAHEANGLASEAAGWQEAAKAATAAKERERLLSLATTSRDAAAQQAADVETHMQNSRQRVEEEQAVLEIASSLEPQRQRASALPVVADQRVVTTAASHEHATLSEAFVDATARLVDAEALLTETTSVNALTRRWRRLPQPDEQLKLVDECRRAAFAAEIAANTASDASSKAAELLREIEQLDAELAPHGNVPRREDQEQRVAVATSGLSGLLQRHHDLVAEQARAAEAVRDHAEALRIFEDEYRMSSREVLARSADHEVALSGARARMDILAREALQMRHDLEELLRTRLAALRDWGLTSDRSGDAETMHLAIERSHQAAVAQLDGHDLRALRNQQAATNDQIRSLESEIASIDEQLKRVEESVIADATIVATTLTRAYLRDAIQARRFDTVLLDEASMAPIPALWVAASLADRAVVAVGDFLQLPPIVLSSSDLSRQWLGRDIFSAAGITSPHGVPPHFVALTRQYRMHPDISGIVNTLIYDGQLTDDETATSDDQLAGWYRSDWGHDHPVLMIDTESVGAWVTSVARGDGSSRLNFLSATICVDLAEQLLSETRPRLDPRDRPRIMIVCPYRPHAQLLNLMLREQGLDGEVRAGTVHTFQGSESDIVILDLVNDEPHWKVGLFMGVGDDANRRLFNVAITRARRRVFIVGDLDWNSRNAKKAFLGRELLPLLRDRYPVVDALDITPSGLAARAAKAQSSVLGGPVEAPADRIVVTQEHFFAFLAHDLATATSRVVIYSAFITENRLGLLEPQLRAAVGRGVAVYVITKARGERNRTDQAVYRHLESALTEWGVIVIHKRRMHEKLVFIDQDVLWSGSLNPLSYSNTQEVMERRRNERVLGDYGKTLRIDDLLGACSAGPMQCPICGSEIEASEGKNDPFFWRCPEDDCYTRSIDQAPLTDGQIRCGNCGGEVEYGEWGGEPHWRCTENRKHRQRIARTHLRLPRMRALVPNRDLRKLDSRFGLGNESRTNATLFDL